MSAEDVAKEAAEQEAPASDQESGTENPGDNAPHNEPGGEEGAVASVQPENEKLTSETDEQAEARIMREMGYADDDKPTDTPEGSPDSTQKPAPEAKADGAGEGDGGDADPAEKTADANADTGGKKGGEQKADTLTKDEVEKIVRKRTAQANRARDKEVQDLKERLEKAEAQKATGNSGDESASGDGAEADAGNTPKRERAPVDDDFPATAEGGERFDKAVDLYMANKPWMHLLEEGADKGGKQAASDKVNGANGASDTKNNASAADNPFANVVLDDDGLADLDIVQTVLDSDKSGVSLDDFVDMENEGKIRMTPEVLGFMAKSDDNAINVAKFFMENPVESKRVARMAESDRTAALKSIADGSFTAKTTTTKAKQPASLKPLPGTPAASNPGGRHIESDAEALKRIEGEYGNASAMGGW